MSWAEDNGIDDYSCLDDLSNIEEKWLEGIHIDRNGNEYKIYEMEKQHLLNTINYFGKLNYDVRPLKNEYLKR